MNFRKLVVISSALKERYLKIFSFEDQAKVQVAHDAADLPKNDETEFRHLSEEKINVGYFGNLNAERGIWIISELAKRFPAINFHIFGGQPEDVSSLKSKLRNYRNVFIYGFVPYLDAEKYRQAMDVLIAPYQDTVVTSDWMSPLKIFEYMAAGKAIICSDFPVLREILADDLSAIMVQPQDVEEWQRALERLSKDAELRNRLGANARDTIARKYTWTTRAAKVIDEYHIG
jgi:glycosyltransferase involved in cell wall biosynthesis